MNGAHERFSEQFRLWEIVGRGWAVWPHPVSPEPPFRPFRRKPLHETPAVDDGRRPTFLSSLVQKISQKLSDRPPPAPREPEPEDEPEPEALRREPQVELQTSLPAKLDIGNEAFAQFFRNLSHCRSPIAFEILGIPGEVRVQFAADSDDAPQLRRQLKAYFPEAEFQSSQGVLSSAWESSEGEETLVIEFGLAREFMYSLEVGKLDPFVGLVGVLSELKPGELGLFQVLFQPADHRWAESIVASVTDAQGKPFFINAPELAAAAEEKVSQPLHAAVVRIAVRSDTYDEAIRIAGDLATSLSVFACHGGNELIPLSNDGYPEEDHVEDVLRRQSRRYGMLLNSAELIGVVHLPGSDVCSPLLARDSGKTKAAPAIARIETGLLLGNNTHLGATVQVRLAPEQRVRHMHVIGGSGTGKSTLLFNLISEDIRNGEGVAVLDPHGDLVNSILGIIPPHRVEDVVLFDPSDEEYSIGFNILSAHSDLEKTLLSSDLVSIFERLSTSWGDQMGIVLQNAIMAFLESSVGGTLADLRRFLVEPAFREMFLETVGDPDVVYYWRKDFAQLSGNRSIGPVLTRLQTFLAPKPIRYMVSQKANRLDFRDILDTGKIFLAKLPQGQIGKENAFLLGSLLVAKFQQLVMGRQAQKAASRKDYWLYIDEFQDFITPSVAEILRGARKYRLGLILAHQELRHLERDREVESAVLSNCGTRVVFHVSDEDARKLGDGFASFEARSLQNLETGQAICRIERADCDFNLSVPLSAAPDPHAAEVAREAVIKASRARYATPRAEVEMARSAAFATEPEQKTAKPTAAPHGQRGPKTTATESPKPSTQAKTPEQAAEVQIDPAPALSSALKSDATTETPPQAVSEPSPPRELGRGGAQHKAIQERLQKEAHALGFLAKVESPIEGETLRAADLGLRLGNFTLAVEISVTTTTDHEFGNVKKCLSGGFDRVAVVSPEPERLEDIRRAVEAALGKKEAEKVGFHTPDDFISELRTLAAKVTAQAPPEPLPNERTSRGYKVRRHRAEVTPEESRARQETAIDVVAKRMKKKP